MAQVTWRASDELIGRVQSAAGQAGRSMNQFVTEVLDAATDPEVETDDALRVRERLARAGLLVPVSAPDTVRFDPAALARARARAGQGVSMVDLVVSERT